MNSWTEGAPADLPNAGTADEDINKYGVPVGVWANLTPKQRQYYYRKLSQAKLYDRHLLRSKVAWARMTQEEKDRSVARSTVRRRVRLEEERQLGGEAYEAKVDKRRAQWREKYWRNHQKQLEQSRRREARKRSQKQIADSPEAIFHMIDEAVSKVLPRFVRDDVIATMCLAVLEGKLIVENIAKEAKKFVTSYNREFDHFKTMSLEAPINGSDGMTFMDRLADPASEREE